MKPFRKFFAHVAAALAFGPFAALHAHASCSVVSAAPASFGTVTSFVAARQPQSTSTTSSGLSCSGALLGLFVIGDQINATITSANGGKLVGSTGDALPYSVFADQNYSIKLDFGVTYNWASGQLLNLLGIFGGPTQTLPLYFRTIQGSNVAAGTYTDTLTIAWNWNYCSGIGILGICLGRDQGSGAAVVPVTITVTNDCVIAAPDVNFGAAPTVAGFAPVTGSVSLTCTKGMVYTVGLSRGTNPHASGRRQMANGANRLQYDIFGAGGGAVWGQSTNRAGSGAAADGQSAQQFPYTARIYSDQQTPAVGTYTDSVVVDVRY
ncbi:spore coat U domain-containing protein [Burkholderia oklahomensis]|uniref:Csu type fimbrial protein n=1 Tax=Burkholderia oklahomensis TaxID=342113 RepID=UPI002650B263|nr:spore coat U domain-containing protein [Burkholderia oklahomensis]MDN7673546.1 spore coat U domain-containing protein [Burkholderia oklahomensis]